MTNNGFFTEQTEQSLVKATIVERYFDIWANVIISTQKRYPSRSQKIAYIDLFAGCGRYEKGAKSTPVKVLENAVANPDIRSRLVTIFNDKDEATSRCLEQAITAIPGIKTLKYKPKVLNEEVGDEIVKIFENMSLIPTLFFVDPWGYRGLSLRLVDSVLKDWGCDCIFFFNYNRINMGLSNPMVREHMNALFGENRASQLCGQLDCMAHQKRELVIVEELCQAIKSYGARHTLPFRFKNARGTRTSHHLIFVSKHFRGYEIMKEIMAKESTSASQGVPSFEYSPADLLPKQSLLFQLSRPLDDLRETLLVKFAGQTLFMQQVYEQHSIDTPYIKKNYKTVLLEMENSGEIQVKDPNNKKRRKGFADRLLVHFPG